MGLFGRKKRSETVGLYGKHPDADDFLRLNAGSPELRALDEWLSGALAASERLIADWEAIYPEAPTVSFIFDWGESKDTCLLGTLAPSSDRAGRRFPLVLFAEVDLGLLAQEFPQVPSLSFITQAQAIHARQQGLGREQLMEAARALGPPAAATFASARQRQEEYLDTTTLQQAFGNTGGDGWLDHAINELQQVCSEVGPDRPLPRFGVRIPLGNPPAAQAGLWLGLIQQMCPARIVPNALWSESCMVVHFSRPSSKALVALWQEGWQDDTLLDLAQSPQPAPSRLPPDRPLRALFAVP
jgi:type VI secretion system protein ImpM